MTEKPASTNTFPARLHVLLARDALTGVVIRRGPARHVCTIGWDRKTDTFTTGQWLKGRIYERRSDLSPDGKHLIYFALNGRWHNEMKGSWTAISIAPYLKAVGLWSKGDAWFGGGLFIDKRTYWLNGDHEANAVTRPPGLKSNEVFPGLTHYGGECPGVYYPRLMRDGWALNEALSARGGDDITVFEKPVHDHWTLRKFAHATVDHQPGTGCYYDHHELVNTKIGETIDGAEWEWADLDRRRLVWATGGKLFAAGIAPAGLFEIRELHDFNAMKFEPIEAPY